MQHNIFLPKYWDMWSISALVDYRTELGCIIDYHQYPMKIQEQLFDALNCLRVAIIEKSSPVLTTMTELTSLAVNDDAAYRVVAGIVIMYDSSHDWLRAQAKLQIWMIDNWGVDDEVSLAWIQANLDSHSTLKLSQGVYPKYIDLR